MILHGFLGSSDNWQTLGRRFGESNTVFLIDLRNHGRSPHTSSHTYPELAEDLEAFMDEHFIQSCSLLGHSMGGKVAMQTALFIPERIHKLIVVDIAPKPYAGGHEEILQAMRSLVLDEISTRKEAEHLLQESIQDIGIVRFLMKNLSRDENGAFRWKVNLETLYRQYGEILKGVEKLHDPYPGPALFLKGEQSGYIREEDSPNMLELFPKAKVLSIPEAGHWVHAEQPDLLFDQVRIFLDE